LADIEMASGWEPEVDAAAADLLATRLGPEIAADAKEAAPRDTGRLADSIEYEVSGTSLRVGSNLDYALPVEEGHRIVAWGHETGEYQPPRPFLKPALYRARG
jgi:hypothetical protein